MPAEEQVINTKIMFKITILIQVCVVYAGVRGFLDNVVTSEIPKFEEKFLAFLKESHPKIIEDILR